jgi:hypothetical protein
MFRNKRFLLPYTHSQHMSMTLSMDVDGDVDMDQVPTQSAIVPETNIDTLEVILNPGLLRTKVRFSSSRPPFHSRGHSSSMDSEHCSRHRELIISLVSIVITISSPVFLQGMLHYKEVNYFKTFCPSRDLEHRPLCQRMPATIVVQAAMWMNLQTKCK